MSKRLDRRLMVFFFPEPAVCLRKNFCAWLATWVGVLVVTNPLEMPRQSPLPSFSSPAKNSLCSSSLQGTPFFFLSPMSVVPFSPRPPSSERLLPSSMDTTTGTA
ncbi:hypothetical protein PR202_gb02279 [Eleusine coracana subsp. coracana]|uniref:Uncharacterized protein n=1 Tax=Eleusine coracana subsp. coracana TaxID=191504 RepID=A0AAV5DYL9_ELECO|nr:hypothetical protein PR202_gb02279 [Eleusine coracana subsp. coracana]